MRNAKVFIVEDNKDLNKALCRLLSCHDHEVVLKAFSVEEAIDLIVSGQLKEKRVSVAIVDGMLPPTVGQPTVFGGPVVARAIRSLDHLIKVIAFTAENEGEKYGDFYVKKPDFKPALEFIAFL